MRQSADKWRTRNDAFRTKRFGLENGPLNRTSRAQKPRLRSFYVLLFIGNECPLLGKGIALLFSDLRVVMCS